MPTRRSPPAWHPESWAGAVVRLAQLEATSGVTLVAAVIVALVWANEGGYAAVWQAPLHWPLLPASEFANVQELVNNGLMTIFFLGVGLEVGRERTTGSLRDTRNALLPVVAALGGMVGAAIVYLVAASALGSSPEVLRGWGVPMATDVAFTLAAMALLGRRIPSALRVFVLALAVADDVGSVIVLAIVSSSGIRPLPLVGAAACIAAVAALRRRVTRARWPYVAAVIVTWWLLAWAGVEPTLAGAFVGMLVPCRHTARDRLPAPGAAVAGPAASTVLENVISPMSALFVMPVFAIANTGILIGAGTMGTAGAREVVTAIVVARLVGKTLGIALGVAVLVRFSVLGLPEGVSWSQLAGAAAMCGIGFTVPLLFATSAFEGHPALIQASQIGLLVGSVLAFVLGTAMLVRAGRNGRATT